MQTEFVPVPKDLKGHVIGKGGSVIQDIIQRSGAEIDRDEEGFTVRGDAQQIARAKSIILEKVVSKKKVFIKQFANSFLYTVEPTVSDRPMGVSRFLEFGP